MHTRAFFVAATGQNVGKTTSCLGLVSGLIKRGHSVGYLKPVGQEYAETETGAHVDKDVVLFPRGFTRNYLDGEVSHDELVRKIERSFAAITSRHRVTVIEGTGHTGVGSIVDLNNAQVAALLKVPLLLIASGGLGSSFDELELNRTQCEKHNVRVAGVILNRVLDEKRTMIQEYMQKALCRWNIPLLGCIPFAPFLSTPTMNDFELLFDTKLLTGNEHRWRHYENIRLVASSVEMYRTFIAPQQLIITPAGREDIILATLTRFWDLKIAHPEDDLQTGLILTGKIPPKDSILEQIKKANIPMLYVPVSSFIAMKMIHSYTTKIRSEDRPKIAEAVKVVESHIDFDLLEQSIK